MEAGALMHQVFIGIGAWMWAGGIVGLLRGFWLLWWIPSRSDPYFYAKADRFNWMCLEVVFLRDLFLWPVYLVRCVIGDLRELRRGL